MILVTVYGRSLRSVSDKVPAPRMLMAARSVFIYTAGDFLRLIHGMRADPAALKKIADRLRAHFYRVTQV